MQKLHAKTGQGYFIKFENSLHCRQQMGTKFWSKSENHHKKYKVCSPQRHYRHGCNSLQQHSAGGNSQKCRPRYRIYSDDGPILRFHVRYNRHRHRPSDGNQQLCYTLGSGTIRWRIWITYKLHFHKYRSTIRHNWRQQLCEKLGLSWRRPNVYTVISLTPAMEQIF